MKAKLFGRDTTVFGKSIGQFINNPEYNLEGEPKRWHKKELGEKKGEFGTIWEEYKGKPKEAIQHLIKVKEGEVPGALHHKDIGAIDLVWGKEGTGHSDGFGLSKIAKYHPEVLENLQEILDEMEVKVRKDSRVKLESHSHEASVSLNWLGKEKTWLLTEYKKAGRTMNVSGDFLKEVGETTPSPNIGNKNKETLSKSQVKSYKLFGKLINLDDKLKEGKEFPLQGELNFQGLKIVIENRKGSVRKGVDNDGEEWRTLMFYPYGYIKGNNEGVDGDKVDVYIGPNKESRKVFVIHQKDPETGKYDEDKCMLGFNDERQARDAYLAHYDDYRFLGDIVEMDIDEFKQKLKIYKGKMIKSLKSEGGRFITENELLAHRFPINSKVSFHGEIWVVKGHGKWGCYLQSEDGIRTIKGQINYKDLELIEPLKKGKVKEYLFEKDSKPVIAIDFDGVLHKYSKGYGDGSLYDKSMEGVSEALKQLSKQYDIVIFTTRENTGMPPEMGIEKDENTVWGWLIKNKLDNYIYDITNKKPVEAKLFIDDRALEFKNWNDALDKVEDKIKKSINSSTLEEATEYEAEHEDLYQELSRRLKEDGSKMPMSEDEFFEWIATEHLGENPNYYSLLKKYVEVKKSKGNSFLGRILNLFKGTKIKDLMQLDLFGQAHAEGDSFSKDGKQYQVKRGANGAVRVHRVDSQLDLFGKNSGKVEDKPKPKLTLKTKTAKKNNDEQLNMFPGAKQEAKPKQNNPEQLDIFNDKSEGVKPSSTPSAEAIPSIKIIDKQSDKKIKANLASDKKFEILATSKKGAKLITDGEKVTWIMPKQMRSDGTFTEGALKALDESTKTYQDYVEEQKERANPNQEIKPIKETDNAIAIIAYSNYYNHVIEDNTAQVTLLWVPKKIINERGEAPKWFLKKKLDELQNQDGHGFHIFEISDINIGDIIENDGRKSEIMGITTQTVNLKVINSEGKDLEYHLSAKDFFGQLGRGIIKKIKEGQLNLYPPMEDKQSDNKSDKKEEKPDANGKEFEDIKPGSKTKYGVFVDETNLIGIRAKAVQVMTRAELDEATENGMNWDDANSIAGFIETKQKGTQVIEKGPKSENKEDDSIVDVTGKSEDIPKEEASDNKEGKVLSFHDFVNELIENDKLERPSLADKMKTVYETGNSIDGYSYNGLVQNYIDNYLDYQDISKEDYSKYADEARNSQPKSKAAENPLMELQEMKHTKTGAQLFVVSLKKLVGRGEYMTYNNKAKSMGGWYSSFKGDGAIPGFMFKDKKTAEAFIENFTPKGSTEPEHHTGDTKTENGHTYQLNENHRWERVDEENNLTNPTEINNLEPTTLRGNDGQADQRGNKQPDSGTDRTSIEGGKPDAANAEQPTASASEDDSKQPNEGGLSNPVSSSDENSGDNGVQAESTGMGRQQAVRSDGRTDTGTSKNKLVSDSAKPNNGNYELRDKPPVELTKGQRRAINDKVKEIIASGKKSNELTDEEKDTLRQYTGEGGLSSGTSEALTQHYTGYQLINRMFEALNEAGVKYKNVLEPAVGSGNFIGHAPGAKWTAVDIDKTNTEVAKLLYPEAKIYNTPYQEFKGKGFDLIISNVPFLEKMPGEKHALHDFYFIHSLDLAKDNGVVAFVTSKGTMDKLDSAARKEMIERGDVLGCFRLPSSTFEKNAHTSVITDVIFLQKRPGKIPAELSKHKAENELFLESSKTNDGIPLSKYYQAHPENILGDMQVGRNKLYGGVDYHITGEADLSKISLPQIDNYPTQNNDDDIKIRSSVDFEKYAVENNIRYRSSNNSDYFQNVEYDANNNELWVRDGDYNFDDTAMKIKTYKQVEDDELKGKIRILDQLKQLADLKQEGIPISTDDVTDLIQLYQQNYKHPANDKEFKKFFKSNDEMKYFQDLGSYFDEDFNPKEVFSAQTRYSGSGTIEIKADSSLADRAFASEDLHGVIDLDSSTYLKPSDFKELVKLGYNIVGPNKLQNNALYYSGNIYAKIDNAKSLIEDKIGDKEVLEKQLKNLTRVIPEEREIGDISFKGNEKWMEQFRSELGIYVKERDGKHIFEFSMRGVSRDEREIYNKYLNSQPLAELFNTVRDPITGNDKKVPKPEAEQKQLITEANEKLEKAKQAIRDKVMADPILSGQIQSAFNRQYNNYVKPDYNTIIETTLKPFLQELPEGFQFRKNQIEWVAKALYEGKGINAHDVGGGKTLAAIFLARVLKAKGISKKPLFMVPAKTIRKWEREIKMIYPDANIVNLGNLTKDKRNEALFNVSNQNADYVLITHEGFEKIKLPKDKEMEYFRQIVDESMFDEEKKGRAAALQDKRISEFEKVLKEQPVDPRLTFDKLGFDALICDEAHNFKNIGVSSKLTKWGAGKAFAMKAGNDGDVKLDSARSYDLRFKATYINEMNNGKNVFLLTATPTPNKPMELFTMLRHLDPDLLSREYNIRTDRDFASMFFTYAQVQNPERPKGHDNIITSITHGIALRKILDRFVDKLPMQKMNWIKVPESEVVKHYMQPSDSITSIMKDIQERTGNLKSKVQKGDDTLVAIYATGRNAAIDPRLYNSEHARVKIHSRTGDVKTDKIERCIKTVAEVHKEDKEANQLIFLDNSGIQTGVDIHGEIKRELARKGFKENEIAIISGDKITNPATGKDIKATGDKLNTLKQQVADDFNAGKIKVIIGTTKSMGEGMDLQVKTTDIHHLDIPYTPAEIIQRRGRGVRPGNVNEKVREHVYIQGGTFDNLSYSIVSNKTGWNEAMWDKAAADVIDTSADMAGAMPSEDEIRIELERDPVKKQKLIVDLRRKKLASGLLDTRQLHRRAESELKIKQDALKAMPDQLKEAEANKEKIKSFQADLKEIIKDREKYYDIARKYNWGSTAPVKVDWSDSAMEYNLDKVKDAMKDVNWRIDYFKHSIERLPESIAKLQTKYDKTKATADQVEQEVLDFVKRYKMGKDTRDIYNDITLPKEEKDEAIRRFNEEQDMYKSIVIAKIFGKPSVIFKERPQLPGSRRIIKVFGKSL
jgi:hypothetical protein